MKKTIQNKNTITPISYTPDKYNLFILTPTLINYCEMCMDFTYNNWCNNDKHSF